MYCCSKVAVSSGIIWDQSIRNGLLLCCVERLLSASVRLYMNRCGNRQSRFAYYHNTKYNYCIRCTKYVDDWMEL
jgi:hypothetical protein